MAFACPVWAVLAYVYQVLKVLCQFVCVSPLVLLRVIHGIPHSRSHSLGESGKTSEMVSPAPWKSKLAELRKRYGNDDETNAIVVKVDEIISGVIGNVNESPDDDNERQSSTNTRAKIRRLAVGMGQMKAAYQRMEARQNKIFNLIQVREHEHMEDPTMNLNSQSKKHRAQATFARLD